jgi:Zn-dependent protease
VNFDIVWILKSVPGVLVGLIVHELAHAYTAYWLGDSTAKDQGRLTLNPLKHLDPLGFLLIVVAGFGWAKPVVFDPRNLKHRRRDEILIALAGPVSNLVLAVVFLVVARVLYGFPAFQATDPGLATVNLLVLWAVISIGLFVFNLIPIPPLDGSHLYTTFLKEINPVLTYRIYQFGTWGLLALIVIQNVTKVEILPLSPIIRGITNLCIQVLGFT